MKSIQTLLLLLITNFLYSQAGNLDTSFGDEGKTITEFEQISAEANSIVVQSNGKIVLAGIGISDSDEDIIAVRYLSNGQIDTGFADNGKFKISISDFRDRCYDISVDSLDNIFFTGFTFNENFEPKGFVIKVNSNGEIDSTFAQNGIWLSQEPDTREDFREILIQQDGKILIAGESVIFGQSANSTVIRLNPNGALDTDFGQNGIAKIIVPDSYNPRFAKLNSNEEIITGGFLLDNSTNIILSKFNQEGESDMSFGTNGVVIDNTALDEFARDIAIQEDDKILVATGITIASGRDFGLVRFNTDGSLDTSFGSNGKITTDFSQTSNTAHTINLQENGHIILGGFFGITPNHDYALARYDSLGNLDDSFGNGGKITTDFGLDDLAFTSTIQSDGKLLCAGNSKTTDDNSSFSIARYFTQTGTNTVNIPDILNSIKLFPNPSNGKFELTFDLKKSSIISIDLLNINGMHLQKIVDNSFFSKGENTIDIDLNDNSSSGLYLISIQTERGIINQRIVIKR
jgi:uncharacterized delta-60 repeat protein